MNDDTLVDQSLTHLEKVVSSPEIETPLESGGSLLFQACSLVAEKLGVSLDIPTQEKPTIEEICASALVRYREIHLQTDWWKKDHGHFIGFYKKDKKPVSVIFFRHKEYHLVDPETQKHTVIDAKTAALLLDEAVMLYPPLPKEAQKLRGILSAIFSKIQWEYTSIFLIGLATIIFGFAFPITNKILYDYVIPNYNFTVYTQLFLGLFVAVISAAIFFFSRSILMLRIKGILTNKIQISLWDRLLRLPVNFFRTIPSGDLLQRTLIFDQIKESISNSTLIILVNGFFSFFYIILMFVFSWQLALIATGLIFLWGLLALVVLLIKIRYEKQLLASSANIQAFLVQVINAINKVRSAALEKRLFSKWARDFAHNQSLSLKVLNLQNVINASSALMRLLLPLSLFGFVIYMKSNAQESDLAITSISVGSFLAFLAAFTPFSQSLLQMVGTITSLTELVPFWQRVHPLLTAPLEKTEIKADPGILKGEIVVNNLHFRYEPEAPLVLKEVSLAIQPGELIGLVGKTGCGKSTLCRLLFGFEQSDHNTLFFDDQDITEIDIFKVRKQIGFVFQENKIFNGNIYDNLTCGRPCTKEEIDRVLAISTFVEVLESLPMGLDTRLSSIGGLLSGGQKQKLLLARSLLNQPQILIIDEGLNTLDNRAQENVLKNIKALKKTTILTSHRLNVLEMADRIFVMDEGTIVASGTFQELSKQEGLFKRFLERQSL